MFVAHADGCQKRGCIYANCTGNHISYNARAGRFSLTIIHQKGERGHRGKGYTLQLPSELTELLINHLTWGRATLLRHHQARDHGYLLVDHKHEGVPYTPAALNNAWKGFMLNLGAWLIICVCVCVCVCERERERERVCVCVCVCV